MDTVSNMRGIDVKQLTDEEYDKIIYYMDNLKDFIQDYVIKDLDLETLQKLQDGSSTITIDRYSEKTLKTILGYIIWYKSCVMRRWCKVGIITKSTPYWGRTPRNKELRGYMNLMKDLKVNFPEYMFPVGDIDVEGLRWCYPHDFVISIGNDTATEDELKRSHTMTTHGRLIVLGEPHD